MRFETYNAPRTWAVVTYEDDMNTIVNCANCGRLVRYGDAYVSKHIFDSLGCGCAVCEQCYQREWEVDGV